ncbi:MAG: CHAT domain-containing protein [Caldilineaceae bacterium]
MTHNSVAAVCIDIEHLLKPPQIEDLRRISGTADFGAAAYRALGLDATTSDTAPLLLRAPPELLDLPWSSLNNGHEYIVFRRPFALVTTVAPPPPPIKQGPLRILLTSEAASDASFDDDLFLQRFADSQNLGLVQRQEPAVNYTVQHGASERKLFSLIEGARDNGAPFHIWHHVGDVRTEAAGLVFQLSKGQELKPVLLQRLLKLLCDDEFDLRLLLVHTPSVDSRLLAGLAATEAPAAALVRFAPKSGEMVCGLYQHLLTDDLAVAAQRARQECRRGSPHDNSWAALEIVTRTQPLLLIDAAWHAHWRQARGRSGERQRFLFLRANPMDDVPSPLPLDQELRRINEALQWRGTQFEKREQGALQLSDLSRVLNEFHPHLLHFSGHGLQDGVIVLETSDSKPVFVQPEQFAAIVGQFAEIRCVVLNACYSTHLADRLKQSGCVVIGMNDEVSDNAAISFATGFYRALAGGDSVALAFEKAKAEIIAVGAGRDAAMPQISDYEAARGITFFH